MKKNASRLRFKAFFFIYYDQVLNNLYVTHGWSHPDTLHLSPLGQLTDKSS
jgi:hypothetical protein